MPTIYGTNPSTFLYDEFFTRWKVRPPTVQPLKLTVCVKVRLMWERSKWGKGRAPFNPALILEKKKAKPYYRVNERW